MTIDIGTIGILSAVAVVMLVSFVLVSMLKPKAPGAAVSITLENLIGMVAFTLAFASVLLSVNFPLSLAETAFIKFVLLLCFIAFVVIQYSVSFWLTAFWSQGALPMIFAGLFLMVSTVMISVMSGQSFLADVTATRETELRQGSDTYKAALAQREIAAKDAASLAVSDDAASFAQSEISRLQGEYDQFLNSSAQNTRGVNVGTVAGAISKYGCGGHYSAYCAKSSQYQAEIREHKATLDKYALYQGAKSHSEHLQATPLPTAAIDAQIPGFKALAGFVGYPYEVVRDNFWIFLSGFIEASAQLCFIFLGWNRRRRAKTEETEADDLPPPAKVRRNDEPIPALDVGGEILADGLAHVHAGERVLTVAETREYDAWKAQQQPTETAKPVSQTSKKAVGQVYQCVTCGDDFTARTVWQKYCPDCGHAKRESYAKSRGKSA